MSNWPCTQAERPRVLVAGGGIAALEACLALRSHGAEADIAIGLLAPSARFVYRPLRCSNRSTDQTPGACRWRSSRPIRT